MADRYWVGGTAAWDLVAGTKWALTSGGVGGATAPTNADDVFFDAASGAGTVTITSGQATCRDVNFTGFTGTITGATLTAIRNVTLGSGMTSTNFLVGIWPGSGVTATLTSNGKTFASLSLNANAAGTVLLADSLALTGTLTHTSGIFDTNNQSVSASSLVSSNSNARTLTLGSSSLTFSNNAAGWNSGTATNLTVTANTAVVTMNGVGSAVQFASGTVDFNGMSLTWQSLPGTALLNSVNSTFANITLDTGASKTQVFSLQGNPTVTGTLTVKGNSSVNRLLVQSNTVGTQRTITAATVVASNVDFMDIAGAGAGNWDLSAITGLSGDAGGNSGITFTASATQQRTVNGGNWGDSGSWTSRVPLPQDDVVIDGAVTGTISLTGAAGGLQPRSGRNIDFTGFTGTLTASGSPPTWAIYGSITLSSGMTTSIGAVSMSYAGRGTHTITSNGNALPIGTIAAVGGSYTLADAFTMANAVGGLLSLSDGTFDTANQSMLIGRFTSGSTRTRALTLGTSVISLNSTSVADSWGWNGSAGVTMSAQDSTIVISTASTNTRNFRGGSLTYGTLRYDVADSPGQLGITESNTFANLDIGPGRTVSFTQSTTQHVDTWDINGENRDYVYLPGNTGITAPDHDDLDGFTDLEIVALVAPSVWTAGGYVCEKVGSYRFFINADKTLSFAASGGAPTASSAAVGAADETPLWVMVTFQDSDNRVQFFTAPYVDTNTEPVLGDFTQLGVDRSAVASGIAATANGLNVGQTGVGTSRLTGDVYRCIIKNGIGGTTVADFDASTHVTGNDTYTDTTGKVWTLNLLARQGDGRVTIQSSTATNAIVSQRMTETTGKKVSFLGDAHTRDGYLNLDGTGDYVSTPDTADLSITSDIDLRARVSLTDWTPTATQAVIAKGNGSLQESYTLSVIASGAIRLTIYETGGSGGSSDSTALGLADNTVKWIRATWNNTTNATAFYTSDDGVTWTPQGTGSINRASIFDSTGPLYLGVASQITLPMSGRIYRAIVKDGIDGTTVFDADFTQARPTNQSRYVTLADNTAIGHADWKAYNVPAAAVTDSPGWVTDPGPPPITINIVTATATFPAPVIDTAGGGGGDTTVPASAVAAAASIAAPTITATADSITTLVAASASVVAPAVIASADVAVSAVAATASIITPSITSSAVVSPPQLIGAVLPKWVDSPWTGFGKALEFDGVNRGANSQGLDAGNSVSGVPPVSGVGAAGAFCLEAKVRTGAITNGAYLIAGRYAGGSGQEQPVLWINDNRFNAAVRGTDDVWYGITATLVVAQNTNYDVAVTYDGTTMRLFVDGAVDGDAAPPGVQTVSPWVKFMIGRDDDWNQANTGGYPFLGVIDEVRWSGAARYTANYTPATEPFEWDDDALGLWHLEPYASTVTAAASIVAPAVATTSDVATTLVTATAAIAAPTVAADTAVTVSVVAAAATVPAPAVAATGEVTGGLVTATATIVAPTVTATGDVPSGIVTATATIVAPSVTTTATVVVSTVAATASTPAVTVLFGDIPPITTVVATAAVPAPTLSASGTTTTTAVQATASIAAPETTTAVVAAPTTVAAGVTIGTVAVSATSTRAVSVVLASATVGAPIVSATATVSATAVLATALMGTPVAGGPGTVGTNTVTATATISTPTITGTATRIPSLVVATASIVAPTVAASGQASALTVSATASVPAPALLAPRIVPVSLVSATATVPAPTVVIITTAVPSRVLATATVPAPAPTASGAVVVTTVSASATVVSPTLGVSARTTPTVVMVLASIVAPNLHITAKRNRRTVANTATRQRAQPALRGQAIEHLPL